LIASLDETFQSITNTFESVVGEFDTGAFDLSTKQLTADLVATVALSPGDVCYLDTSGQWSLADADDEAKSKTLMGLCTSTTPAGSKATCLIRGIYTTTGLVAGEIQYLSTTEGDYANAYPTSTGQVLRVLGYAQSTTELFWNPDSTWMEIA
jgi:hypothetical protein